MGADVFDNLNDSRVLAKWISCHGREPAAVVLDFFGGSGSTAQAVMEPNRVDGGQRRFFLVQLDEPVAGGSVAQREGYSTIAEIARERLRCVGAKLRADAGLMGDAFDIGFRALRVDSTSMADSLATLGVPCQRLRRLEIGTRADPELEQRATIALTQLSPPQAA